MSLKINGVDVKKVKFNGVDIDKLTCNGVVVWQEAPMFNFTPIDVEGRYIYNSNSTKIPVAYAVGKFASVSFEYNVYTRDAAIPTAKSEYEGKYVYNDGTHPIGVSFNEDGNYNLCSYSINSQTGEETLSPDWVVVGATLTFTSQKETSSIDPENRTDVGKVKITEKYDVNNGFNSKYFDNYDFTTTYSNEADIPKLGLENVVIPDTYNGLPVTEIMPKAFVAGGLDYPYTKKDSEGPDALGYKNEMYAPFLIKHFKLGKNIAILKSISDEPNTVSSGAIQSICRVAEMPTNTFTFNDKLEKITSSSLANIFTSRSAHDPNAVVVLPPSVNEVDEHAFNLRFDLPNPPGVAITDYKFYLNKVIVSSNEIFFNAIRSLDYAIFERSVKILKLGWDSVDSDESDSQFRSIVFKHHKDDAISLSIKVGKSAGKMIIYTDCDAIKNFDFAGQNITVTFKSLSEFSGG